MILYEYFFIKQFGPLKFFVSGGRSTYIYIFLQGFVLVGLEADSQAKSMFFFYYFSCMSVFENHFKDPNFFNNKPHHLSNKYKTGVRYNWSAQNFPISRHFYIAQYIYLGKLAT